MAAAAIEVGRLVRRPGPPSEVRPFAGVEIADERLAGVVSRDAKLLVLYDGAIHSEGPVWVPAHRCLAWSDVENRRLLAWHEDGHVEVMIDRTFFMNGNALDADGDLVHCEHGRRCISRSTAEDEATPFITHYRGHRLNTPNDLTIAADGALWFTDPMFGLCIPRQGCLAEPELDHCSVYRYLPASRSLTRMADFEQPNGLAFSADGRTLYVSDTSKSLGGEKHEIQAFDVAADASLSNRRLFWTAAHGVPDGFRVDRRGWVWTTAGDGLHIVAADGGRLGFIPTPVTCSNCAFGGADGTRLFITAERYLLAIDLLTG